MSNEPIRSQLCANLATIAPGSIRSRRTLDFGSNVRDSALVVGIPRALRAMQVRTEFLLLSTTLEKRANLQTPRIREYLNVKPPCRPQNGNTVFGLRLLAAVHSGHLSWGSSTRRD
jgi:hypothetical protein